MDLEMRKNSTLILSLLWITGALYSATPVLAQDEMDLLLFEKKNETPANDTDSEIDLDIKDTFSNNLAKNNNTKKTTQSDNKNANISTENESENWLQSLIKKGKSEIVKDPEIRAVEEEEERVERILKNRRSNAANFDISGIKLRMTPDEVAQTLTAQGYKQIMQAMEIPNFIKWRSEELCRINGVIGFERLNACATRVARENGYHFVEREVYNRYSTRESIDVYYTSSFTGNLSHRIFYKSSMPLSDSKASKNVYLNNLKIYDFWKRIDMKYGAPDNTSEIKWGLGGKKPYLKAKTGYLELADPLLKDLDMARMFSEDTRLANTHYYSF